VVSIFGAEQALVNPLQQRDRETLLGLAIGAIIGTITPIILTTQLPTPLKSASLLAGAGCSAAAAVVSGNKIARKQNKFAKIIDTTQEDAVLSRMESEIAYVKMLDDIYNNNRILDVVMQLPADQQNYWLNYFGVSGLAASTIAVEAKAILEAPEAVPYTQAVRSSQPSIAAAIESQSTINYDWLSDDFVDASKAVFGAKGSGKSTYLAYEAYSFLHRHPEGELRIGDLHWDPDLNSKDPSRWLWGIDRSIVEQYFVTKDPKQVLQIFRRAMRLLEEREKNNDKSSPPFKFICDEFARSSSRWTDDEKSEVANIIEQVQFGGRKYGVDITLGLHSLKKEMTGIDSSALLGNMDLLCLGMSLADPNTRFPADIDRKALLAEQSALQDTLNDTIGRACVVRRQGYRATVEVMPPIDYRDLVLMWESGFVEADDISDDIPSPPQAQPEGKPGQSAIDLMQQWLDELHRVPTDAELTAQFKALTGRSLDEQGLRYLKQGLGLDGDDNTTNTETEEIW